MTIVPVKPAVLIAEADETLAAAYARYFSRQGYNAATATTGLNCLELLRSRPYEALVLSLELLWGGGDGVLAVMNMDRRLAQLPVVVNSTAPPEFVRSRVVMPPLGQFLQKPFSLSELLACVRLVTVRARVMTPTSYLTPA